MNKELAIYMILYAVVVGIWGFITKITSAHLSWKTNLAFVWMTSFLLHLYVVYDGIDLNFSRWHLLAIVAGILAAIGTVIMYKMIDKFDIVAIRPLLEMNVVITILLAVAFTSEQLTLSRVGGIISAGIAFVLLTK